MITLESKQWQTGYSFNIKSWTSLQRCCVDFVQETKLNNLTKPNYCVLISPRINTLNFLIVNCLRKGMCNKISIADYLFTT